MKTISVIITTLNGKYGLYLQTFGQHEAAMAVCPGVGVVHSYCFNNMKQAREYVRCMNRNWDASEAMGYALGQPKGSIRFSVVQCVNSHGWRINLFDRTLAIVSSQEVALVLAGAMRLHQVNNDAKWEALPISIRNQWRDSTATPRPLFELPETRYANSQA